MVTSLEVIVASRGGGLNMSRVAVEVLQSIAARTRSMCPRGNRCLTHQLRNNSKLKQRPRTQVSRRRCQVHVSCVISMGIMQIDVQTGNKVLDRLS